MKGKEKKGLHTYTCLQGQFLKVQACSRVAYTHKGDAVVSHVQMKMKVRACRCVACANGCHVTHEGAGLQSCRMPLIARLVESASGATENLYIPCTLMHGCMHERAWCMRQPHPTHLHACCTTEHPRS
eukprot:1160461-Pelagomonas_calceolata.AAC.9